MLDILELAADPIKEKQAAGEEDHRQAYYRALMDRLRERNLTNEAIIIKYLRRSTKKRLKSKLTLPIMQGFSIGHTATALTQETNVKRATSTCLRDQTCKVDLYLLQEVKPCQLKTTSNTSCETEPSILTHSIHADTLHLLQHIQQQANKKIPQNESPNMQGAGRYPNSFTKYLRNFFISKLTQKSRLREQELQMRMKARKSYHGRVQTEVQTQLKQKIKVKSLVFGQSEVVCAREACTITGIHKAQHLPTNVDQQTKQGRYGKIEEGHKREKGVLPGIHHSLAARNRRCLENYIRLHQDPSSKPLDFRTVKLPTEAELVYNQVSGGGRRGVGRLGALHVRKM